MASLGCGFHGRGSLALTRDGAPAVTPLRVYVSPSTTSLQVVQRSLSGGFLKEDAALLDANARSMERIACKRGAPQPG